MTADLPQAREGSQDVNLAFIQPFLSHRLENLFPAAAQFGQIKFSLSIAEVAIAALFDSIRQILGHLMLEPAQQEWTQLGGKTAARDALSCLGIFLDARLVGLLKMVLGTEIG